MADHDRIPQSSSASSCTPTTCLTSGRMRPHHTERPHPSLQLGSPSTETEGDIYHHPLRANELQKQPPEGAPSMLTDCALTRYTTHTERISDTPAHKAGEQVSTNGDKLRDNGNKMSINGGQTNFNGDQSSITCDKMSINDDQMSSNGNQRSTNGNQLHINHSMTSTSEGTVITGYDMQYIVGDLVSTNGSKHTILMSINGGLLSINGNHMCINYSMISTTEDIVSTNTDTQHIVGDTAYTNGSKHIIPEHFKGGQVSTHGNMVSTNGGTMNINGNQSIINGILQRIHHHTIGTAEDIVSMACRPSSATR